MSPSTTTTLTTPQTQRTQQTHKATFRSAGMALRLLVIGVVAVLLLDCVAANPLTHHPLFSKREIKTKFCGARLADTLRKVCNGLYNKRSDNSEEVAVNEFRSEDEDWQGIEPNQYRYDYVRISSPEEEGFVRRRRQITEECCKNPCTLMTLRQYCRSD